MVVKSPAKKQDLEKSPPKSSLQEITSKMVEHTLTSYSDEETLDYGPFRRSPKKPEHHLGLGE
jgi:hypothetical protein